MPICIAVRAVNNEGAENIAVPGPICSRRNQAPDSGQVRTSILWRRAGDSNPRFPWREYSLSRRAPSASRSALRTLCPSMIPHKAGLSQPSFRDVGVPSFLYRSRGYWREASAKGGSVSCSITISALCSRRASQENRGTSSSAETSSPFSASPTREARYPITLRGE